MNILCVHIVYFLSAIMSVHLIFCLVSDFYCYSTWTFSSLKALLSAIALKKMFFVLNGLLKKGSEMDRFCFKQDQGFKVLVAHPHPNLPQLLPPWGRGVQAQDT